MTLFPTHRWGLDVWIRAKMVISDVINTSQRYYFWCSRVFQSIFRWNACEKDYWASTAFHFRYFPSTRPDQTPDRLLVQNSRRASRVFLDPCILRRKISPVPTISLLVSTRVSMGGINFASTPNRLPSVDIIDWMLPWCSLNTMATEKTQSCPGNIVLTLSRHHVAHSNGWPLLRHRTQNLHLQ